MAELLVVRYEERDAPRAPLKKIWRAAIRFAPGPYGEIFTEWYTGQTGADLVVGQLLKNFADKEADEPSSVHIKLGDIVRLPNGHFATVTEVGFTKLASVHPTPFVAVNPEGNWRTHLWYRFAGMLRWYGKDIDRLTYVSPEEMRDIEERLDF